MLFERAQSVCLSCPFDVVRDERTFSHEFVRPDNEGTDIPPDQSRNHVAEQRRHHRHDQPAGAARPEGVDGGNYRAGRECECDNEHSNERDVNIGV